MHQPQAEAAGIELTFDRDQSLSLVTGDYNQLSQLVTNLVVNALHYTLHGYVRVSTCTVTGSGIVTLRVADSGLGILPEDIPYLFERFYRGNHRQAHDIPGTGLGLAIVKEIVDIHHGQILVTSKPDEGTIFEVTLPI